MSSRGTISGEDSLIQRYLAPLTAGCPGAFGLEDDCAALTPEPGCDMVLKTDAIAEGIHFLGDDRPEDIAWKAVAVNVSDLAAKGARPIGYLTSLSFPRIPEPPWMRRFAAGLREAQERFSLTLLGGDTDRRPNAPVSITVMIIGSVPAGRMVRRGTARAGELVYVTGTLGDAALGLRLRSGGLTEAAGRLEGRARAFLVRRYLRPEPRTALRQALLEHARAAMDISDGLVKDLGRLCRASRCAADVHAAELPLSPAASALLGLQPDLAVLPLCGGDDYEILASVAADDAAAFETAARSAGVPVTHIGRLRKGSGVVVRGPAGVPLDLARTGYDHFGE